MPRISAPRLNMNRPCCFMRPKSRRRPGRGTQERGQEELDGLNGRIAKLQQREATITARVDELRSIFTKSFGAFAVDDDSDDAAASQGDATDGGQDGGPDVPVVNTVPDQAEAGEEDDERSEDQREQG